MGIFGVFGCLLWRFLVFVRYVCALYIPLQAVTVNLLVPGTRTEGDCIAWTCSEGLWSKESNFSVQSFWCYRKTFHSWRTFKNVAKMWPEFKLPTFPWKICQNLPWTAWRRHQYEISMDLGDFIHHNGVGKSSPSYSWSLEPQGLLFLHRAQILLEAKMILMAFSMWASSQSLRQRLQIPGRYWAHSQHPGAGWAEHHGWEHHSIPHNWNPLGNFLCGARGASWSHNRDTPSPKPAKRAFPGSFLNSFLATCHTTLTWQEGCKRRQTEITCRTQCSF